MRQPKPWYRTSKGAWYVEIDGKQVRLIKGPKKETESAAFDGYHNLMARHPSGMPEPEKMAVAMLCDLFLEHCHKRNQSSTYSLYQRFLQSFCKSHGRILAKDLKPFHVNRWLDQHPTWKASRRHAALAVKRAYNWADRQGVLGANPLRMLEIEPGNRRTRVLSREEQAEILQVIRDSEFRSFVTALLETGCRPGEVARVTAADVNLDVGVWVFQNHKTSKKTRRPRVVYLSPKMLDMTRILMAKYPEGPLFRGPRGQKPFTSNGIRCRFRRLRKSLPHLPHFVGYTARHTFATEALLNGIGIAQVAELLGHTSTEMVSSTYGHLSDQAAHLRETARKARAD